MSGRFHVEQNVFSAIGKIIEGSGGPYILLESGAIATGSLPQFLKEKTYYRCRRIHTLLPLDEAHLDAVRRLILPRGFQPAHQQVELVRAMRLRLTRLTDLLIAYAKDLIQS